MVSSTEAAVESLRQIKSTEPPAWLVSKQELSQAVRTSSKLLFSSLKPHCTKSPFDQLLIEGFDAEQIWQQIDLQSQPLLSSLRREVKKFEKHPEEISKLMEGVEGGKKKRVLEENETDNVVVNDDDDEDDIDMDEDDDDGDDDDDDDDAEEEEEEKEKMEKEKMEKERGREEESENEGEGKDGIEDKFLKIKELQEYLEEDEAREFVLNKKKKKTETKKDEDDEENEDDNDETEEEEDELGLFDGNDEYDEDDLENARF